MQLPEILQIEAVGYRGFLPYKTRGALPPSFMPFDAFCSVLQQMPGLRRLHIGGAGDPLLHPRFFDMVRHAAQQGIEVSADSALTALSDARAEACVESGLVRLHVPHDPSDAVLQRYLKRLQAAKDRLGTSLPEVIVGEPPSSAEGRCDRPWRAVYLGTSCDALPCDQVRGSRRPSFGNAAKEGVLRVWNGEAFREFRDRLSSDAPPEACAGCQLRHSPVDFGQNAAWSESAMPPKSVPSSTTAQSPTAA